MSDVDNWGGYARVETGGIWQISELSSQFCCKPKTALKIKVFFWKVQMDES